MSRLYIEASCLGQKYTGIEKTIGSLIKTLQSLGASVNLLCPEQFVKRSSWYYYYFFIHNYCSKNLDNNDIFLIPNNMGKFWRLPHNNTWVIVHDLIPLTSFGYKGLRRLLYRYKMSRLKKATKIIVISECVKKQLCDEFDIPYEKVDVLYWSRYIDDFEGKTNKSSYYLSIGTGEPRKNTEFLIKNWDIIGNNAELLLFGKEWRPGIHAKLQQLIDACNMKGVIKILGPVSENKLYDLYSSAKAFIFPSVEEGFGTPPLEALAHGCNIILPKTPINYELYGNCAYMYSLGSVKELSMCLKDAENQNVEKNIKFSERYNTDIFREKVKQIFGVEYNEEKENLNKR